MAPHFKLKSAHVITSRSTCPVQLQPDSRDTTVYGAANLLAGYHAVQLATFKNILGRLEDDVVVHLLLVCLLRAGEFVLCHLAPVHQIVHKQIHHDPEDSLEDLIHARGTVGLALHKIEEGLIQVADHGRGPHVHEPPDERGGHGAVRPGHHAHLLHDPHYASLVLVLPLRGKEEDVAARHGWQGPEPLAETQTAEVHVVKYLRH